MTPPPDGIYRSVLADDYFGWDAVSNSVLSRFARFPALAHVPMPDAPNLALGRAVHCAILEPGKFYASYRLLGGARPTKTEKAVLAENGAIGLSPDSFHEIRAMTESVRRHFSAALLLSEGEAEVSLIWTDEETGLRCKARVDWLGEIAAVDIKTTKDASPAGFAKAVANYHYHVQQAHYLAGCAALGLPASDFVFVAVEKAEPYPVACYQLSDAAEGVGYRLWRRDLTAFATCQKADRWPAYSDEIEILNLPAWALNEESANEY